MAPMASIGILTIFVVLAELSHTKALQSWLGTLAAMVALAVASNQAIHSLSEIRSPKGIDGLANAITKIVAPFAVFVVAMVVSDQHFLWAFFGFFPLVALFWLKPNNRCVKHYDHPTDPPSKYDDVRLELQGSSCREKDCT